MALNDEMLDELLKDYQKPEDLIGENGLLKQLTKALVERALKSELTHHLGYGQNEQGAATGSNRRNGTSRNRGSTRPGKHVRAAHRGEEPDALDGL
jgi:putative transposase